MNVLIAGGTGFVGRALVDALVKRGDSVSVMSRSPGSVKAAAGSVSGIGYDADVEGFDAVVNLAGAGIADKRWTVSRKTELLSSRTGPTSRLAKSLADSRSKAAVFVNASAVGFYGSRGDEELDEKSKVGTGFLPEICTQWEGATKSASDAGIRTVLLRIGIVLEKDGGALKKMVTPFKLFVGGRLGSGKQWMSWIHRDDVVGLILHSIDNPAVSGPVNATAPNPATNADFSRILAKTLGRPCLFPVPGFVLKLMLGEMSELLLEGQKVHPTAALATGYSFHHPDLRGALTAILR